MPAFSSRLDSTNMSEPSNATLSSPTTNRVDLEKQDTKEDTAARGQFAAHLTQSNVERPQTLVHESAFVFILGMAQFMTQAALAQSIAPSHIIGASFGTTSPAELSWFPAAYSLTVGTFILIAGRLGDLYGHKKLFIGGFAWFALSSLLAGFSVYSNILRLLASVPRHRASVHPPERNCNYGPLL
jgi:hypothetical protein